MPCKLLQASSQGKSAQSVFRWLVMVSTIRKEREMLCNIQWNFRTPLILSLLTVSSYANQTFLSVGPIPGASLMRNEFTYQWKSIFKQMSFFPYLQTQGYSLCSSPVHLCDAAHLLLCNYRKYKLKPQSSKSARHWALASLEKAGFWLSIKAE